MSHEHDLIVELRTAREGVRRARSAEQEARAAVLERKADRIRAEAVVEEIVAELETGKSGRPILDHLAKTRPAEPLDPPEEETADERQRGVTTTKDARGHEKGKPARQPTRVDLLAASKKSRHWQNFPLVEILPEDDDYDDEREEADIALCEKVRAHLELPDELEPTVGDLATIWLMEKSQPHTLEDLHALTGAERERLRSALLDFRMAQRWPAAIGLPNGFPLAWILPEPDENDEPESVEWTSPDLDEGLNYACTRTASHKPIIPYPWEEFRKLGGITDVQIAEVLRDIWPQIPSSRVGPKCLPWITVRGGVVPAFWVGRDASKPPTLCDKRLVDRVRQVLDLPRFTAGSTEVPISPDDLAGTAPAAKPKRKEAAHVGGRQ